MLCKKRKIREEISAQGYAWNTFQEGYRHVVRGLAAYVLVFRMPRSQLESQLGPQLESQLESSLRRLVLV